MGKDREGDKESGQNLISQACEIKVVLYKVFGNLGEKFVALYTYRHTYRHTHMQSEKNGQMQR